MASLGKTLTSSATWFDRLPTPLQITVYAGLATYISSIGFELVEAQQSQDLVLLVDAMRNALMNLPFMIAGIIGNILLWVGVQWTSKK